MARLLLLAASLLAIASVVAAQCSYYNTPVVGGYSSWYNSWSSGGGCGNINQPIPTGLNAAISAAINQNEFYSGKICGMCLLVTAVTPVAGNTDPNPFPATPFVTYINDLCTTCTTNQLDFYRSQQIGNNWNLNWTAVDCPVGNNPVQLQYKNGMNQYYYIVIPIRQKVAVTNIEVLMGSNYVQMTKISGNGQWELSLGGSPNQNPTFRLTGCTGEQIVITPGYTVVDIQSTTVVSGDKNFAGTGTAAPSAATGSGNTNTNTMSSSSSSSSPSSTGSAAMVTPIAFTAVLLLLGCAMIMVL